MRQWNGIAVYYVFSLVRFGDALCANAIVSNYKHPYTAEHRKYDCWEMRKLHQLLIERWLLHTKLAGRELSFIE